MRRISIIIATHNRPHLVTRAVQSARAAGSDVEIIVVDDASTDTTANVCRNLPDIRYVRVERNQGVAGARNLGILASDGEFISFLDDDDERLPQSLDIQIEALESAPDAAFVYGQVLIRNQSGASSGSSYPLSCPQGNVFWQLLERNFVPCGSVVLRKSRLYRVGLLDDSIPGLDDWDLWIRLAEIYSVAAIEKPVAIWRQPTPFSEQGSSKTVDLIALSTSLMRERWLKLPRAAKASRSEKRRAWNKFSMNVSEHLAWQTTTALACGRFGHAGRSLRSLLRLDPAVLPALARRWARASTVHSLITSGFSDAGLANTKARFKHVRSRALK